MNCRRRASLVWVLRVKMQVSSWFQLVGPSPSGVNIGTREIWVSVHWSQRSFAQSHRLGPCAPPSRHELVACAAKFRCSLQNIHASYYICGCTKINMFFWNSASNAATATWCVQARAWALGKDAATMGWRSAAWWTQPLGCSRSRPMARSWARTTRYRSCRGRPSYLLEGNVFCKIRKWIRKKMKMNMASVFTSVWIITVP